MIKLLISYEELMPYLHYDNWEDVKDRMIETGVGFSYRTWSYWKNKYDEDMKSNTKPAF